MGSVLIIDDDKELCALMKKCIEQEEMSALVANGGTEGLRLIDENKNLFSLVILDVLLLINCHIYLKGCINAIILALPKEMV